MEQSEEPPTTLTQRIYRDTESARKAFIEAGVLREIASRFSCFVEFKELSDGAKIKILAKEVSSFEHGSRTNLLFGMDDVKLDVGKLALWRLESHSTFGGTWLSDYVPNRLGGFAKAPQPQEQQKPDCPLLGADGNVFNLMGIASRTLKDSGMAAQAAEMRDRITSSGSYDAALVIIGEYVNITAAEGYESQDEGEDFCMDEMT